MKRFSKAQMLEAILDRVRAEGLRETARRVGIDAGNLSHILNGHRAMSDDNARRLGFERLPTFYVLVREEKG